MVEQDDILKYFELRKKLISTDTSIITPLLGKGKHLHNAYLRALFIAKVIDFLAEKAIFSKIIELPDDIIITAVSNSSRILSFTQTQEILQCLLYEMSDGLELLDRTDLGVVKVPNPAYQFDKNQPPEIEKHRGFNYMLSEKGFKAYQKQEFQILATNLISARISRVVSYSALLIALAAFIVRLF